MSPDSRWFEWVFGGGVSALFAGLCALVARVLHLDRRVAAIEASSSRDQAHAEGERVLFVAEKMAALEVVKKRVHEPQVLEVAAERPKPIERRGNGGPPREASGFAR